MSDKETVDKLVFGQKRVTNNDDDDRIIVSSYKLVRTKNQSNRQCYLNLKSRASY